MPALTCGNCADFPCDNGGGHLRSDKACSIFKPYELKWELEDADSCPGAIIFQKHGREIHCFISSMSGGHQQPTVVANVDEILSSEIQNQISQMVFEVCEIQEPKFVRLSLMAAFDELQKQHWYPKKYTAECLKEENVTEEQSDIYPEHVMKAAHEILNSGNALDFILDTWNHYHVGDRTIGESCACSVAATYILNSKGLHIKPSGKSGKGKSDSTEKFARLLPTQKVFIGSMSGKAAYYAKNFKPGSVLLLDDVNLNEDLSTTIKTATSNFQRPAEHRTVRKQDSLHLRIPERCVWWLTSVDGFDDEQMGNRFLGVDVDESEEQDEAVFHKQVEAELYGSPKDTDDILICRAIYDILGQEQYIIRAPYMNSIHWFNKGNRRNFPMFMDILKCVTLYNIKQREKFHDCYLATVEDFERAKKIYQGLAETNATNLTEKELKVIRWMSDPKRRGKEVERKDIQAFLGISHVGAKNILHGKDGNGGLLNKVCALNHHLVTVQYDGRSTQKYVYIYNGVVGLDSYTDVVSLDYSRLGDGIKAFKNDYVSSSEHEYITYTGLKPDLNTLCLSDKSISIDNIGSTLKLKKNNVSTKGEQAENVYVSDNNTHSSLNRFKSATDSKNIGLSRVKAEECAISSPDFIDSVNKWLIDWERVYKQSINSQNYVDVAMEYAKGHKIPSEQIDDVLFAVKMYAKLADPEMCQTPAEKRCAVEDKACGTYAAYRQLK